MQQVAAMVEPCSVVADVGCDHGYVSIYLVEQKIVSQAIAMDVRKGPLSKAKEHVAKKQLQERIQCRLSDGLNQLEPGEADTIIIAGMGGPLMIDILKRGCSKGMGMETLVLQPQSEVPKVRYYLHSIDYEIVKEAMLQEDGKFYTVIKAKPQMEDSGKHPKNQREGWTVVEYQYGKDLLTHRSPVLHQYLMQEQGMLMTLRSRLSLQETKRAKERLEELEKQLKWNQEAGTYYEVENHYTMA